MFLFLIFGLIAPIIMFLVLKRLFIEEQFLRIQIVLLGIVLSLFGWFGFSFEHIYLDLPDKIESKKLVSASQETRYQGSFSLLYGTLNQKRYYLLREEIRDGYYKDFEVKHEVYIREDREMEKNKGEFVQIFKCRKQISKFRLAFIFEINEESETCKYDRQEIVVPYGHVVKEISI